ncbi:MAG: M48 family metalloprotease [Betaproteobacteria bacterium]
MFTLAAATAIAATAVIAPFSSGESAKPETGEEQRVWGQAKEFNEAIRKSAVVYRDEAVTAYVQSVMARLFPEFGGGIRVQVVQAPQLNAFALPDGYIYVNLGLLARFQNEAQLATVLAHEGTHFTHRHGFRNQKNLKSTTAFASVTAMLGVPVFPQLIAISSIFGFSRELESEADNVGYERLARAGYDVREAPLVFEHLAREVKAEGIEEPFFFASHPKLKERIDNMTKLSAKAAAGGAGSSHTDYARMMTKARIDNLESQLSMGRAKSALLMLEDPAHMAELPPFAAYYLGEAYRLRGQDGDTLRAEQAYLKAVSVSPEFAPSHRALGVHYLKANQYTEAARYLSRYLELAPEAKDRTYIQNYLKTAERKMAGQP